MVNRIDKIEKRRRDMVFLLDTVFDQVHRSTRRSGALDEGETRARRAVSDKATLARRVPYRERTVRLSAHDKASDQEIHDRRSI
jgi:hypothetical protein